MQKPEPLKPSQLQHPKASTYKAWNGDERKKASTRWNGAPEMEDKGFASRGVHTVSRNLPQTNLKPMQSPRRAQPVPEGHVFDPMTRSSKPIPKPLTERQKRMKRG